MLKTVSLLIFGVFLLLIFPTGVFAEHIFEDSQAFGQFLDISELMSPKFTLDVDGHQYDIYYGYGGSLDADMTKMEEEPVISSMILNQDRKSLEIFLDIVPEDTIFWVKLPLEVMTADGANYQLLVDGKETPYDLTKFPNAYAIGIILPKDAQNIEIIGTYVIPEFGVLSITVLGITFFAVLFVFRGKSRFFNYN